MIATRKFYSVTIMTTEDDNGFTTTFATAREAADFAEWAKQQGCYHVSQIWM